METSPTVRDRIITAADALYEESGRQTIPTVDAVRKLAKVNINDASNCMREWRRANAKPTDTPRLQVPDALQQTCIKTLHSLWAEAVALAGETLRMAQAGWDAERADAEILSEQIGSACAAQDEELRVAKGEIERLTRENMQLDELLDASRRRADDAERSVIELRAASGQVEARSIEIGKRADDLRQALNQAHATHAATSSEQAAVVRAQGDEITGLRRELNTARERTDESAASSRAELLAAIEEAARLRGKLEAISDAHDSVPAQTTASRKNARQSQ